MIDPREEILDSIQIMVDKAIKAETTKIYTVTVTNIQNANRCDILLNNQTYTVQYYGDTPTVNNQYRVFIPFGEMPQAFIITGGGSVQPITEDYTQLTNKPSINSVTLIGNQTSSELGLYGTDNPPDYPVDSVNNKTGVIVLDATDIGALPDTTPIPTKTSDLTNDSGFITVGEAPVQSVDGSIGDIVLNDVKYTAQTLTVSQQAQVRSNIGAGTSSFSGSYTDLTNKPTIPTKTSQLTNDSTFQTASQVASSISIETSNRQTADNDLQAQITSNDTDIESLQTTKADITAIPTKVSQLTNDSGYLTAVPSEYVTETEMVGYAQPIGDYATNTGLNGKLSLTGGTMSGAINMNSYAINNLPAATSNQQPATFKQLNDAIAGIGTVFDLKGSIATIGDLPSTGNKIGDVWYVESESVGYIWLEDTTGTLRWEKFGEEIDLSGYLTKAGLLQSTGTATENAMSQNAVTTELALKADIADLSNVAFSGLYSDLTGSPTSLPASDVYPWAKQPTKPVYTSTEVGLGNVPNVTTNNQTPTWSLSSVLSGLVSEETLSVAFGKIAKAIQSLISHIANVSNPHNVTKSQVGLGNVDNVQQYSESNPQINVTGSSGSCTGNSATATGLETPRTIQTNLATATSQPFDGTQNITIGVTGTLPPDNGGTGQTSLNSSANSLINSLSTATATPQDNDYYVSQYAGGGATTTSYHRRTMIALWNYIQGKISSVLGMTATSYNGNAASSTKATKDASGNIITTTYAPLISPALTGTPTAPTAVSGTSTTQIATTAFVQNQGFATQTPLSATRPTNPKTGDYWYEILS